jgi:hypothetical protein
MSDSLAIDPLAQHTFVVETNICGTQAAVMFGHVVAQLALPLAVCADRSSKSIHVPLENGGQCPFLGIGRNVWKHEGSTNPSGDVDTRAS